MALIAQYHYFPERREWLGVLSDVQEDGIVVLTVGVEFTEDAIKKWCNDTLKQWEETGEEVPDAYDRRQ